MASARSTRTRSELRIATETKVTKASNKSASTTLRSRKVQNKPKAAVPNPLNRRANKPVNDGLIAEEAMKILLVRSGIKSVWRNPGQRGTSLGMGRVYKPDMAAQLSGLGKYGVTMTPGAIKKATPDANVVIEVKSQHTPGSADQKISGAIQTLAYMADVQNVVPLFILDTSAHGPAEVEAVRKMARQHLVAFATANDIKKGHVLAEVELIAAKRKTLRKKLNSKGGVKREFLTSTNKDLAFYVYRRRSAAVFN